MSIRYAILGSNPSEDDIDAFIAALRDDEQERYEEDRHLQGKHNQAKHGTWSDGVHHDRPFNPVRPKSAIARLADRERELRELSRTPEQQKAVDHWQTLGGWLGINPPLRMGDQVASVEEVSALDTLASTEVMPFDVTLFRGGRGKWLPEENLAGQTFQDLGFTSATPDPSFAAQFTRGGAVPNLAMGWSEDDDIYSFDIAVRAGDHAIVAGSNEVILPRGTTFAVTADERVGNKRRLFVEPVP